MTPHTALALLCASAPAVSKVHGMSVLAAIFTPVEEIAAEGLSDSHIMKFERILLVAQIDK